MARLEAAGVAEPRADAEVLLARVLGTTRAGLVAVARDAVPAAAADALEPLVARRVAREPLHYVVGAREFWSLDFAVDRRVLIPRPETEVTVETALAVAPEARRVLDVGTGCGVIAAVIARALPAARVWAGDRSRDALPVARANLGRHAPGVACLAADLTTAIGTGALDLIVANLPYVPEATLPTLAPEVRDHEPRGALAGGADGIALVRGLLADAPRALGPGGWLVLEVGSGQAEAVVEAAGQGGWFEEARVVRDLAGVARVVAMRRREGEWTRS
jgi:release factor glutamine methyltransferase